MTSPSDPKKPERRRKRSDAERRQEWEREWLAQRAYELYEQRGGEHGHDLDDWLQAERELRAVVPNSAAHR